MGNILVTRLILDFRSGGGVGDVEVVVDLHIMSSIMPEVILMVP